MTVRLNENSARKNRRGWRTLIAASAVGVGLAVGVGGVVTSAAASDEGTGPDGQTIAVSKSSGLDPAGEAVMVQGEGFDVAKGVYVMVCVDSLEGQAPGPCFGGEGEDSEAAAWVSSNPPSYAEGMTTPFDESNGSFEVELTITASDGTIDCLAETNGCVVGTMADHTRPEDRSADVFVPISFGDEAAADETASEPTEADAGSDAGDAAAESDSDGDGAVWAVVAGAAIVIGAGAFAVTRLRRKSES